MKPTNDTALQRPDLGQAVYETLQGAPTAGYIGLQVMPIFRVSEQTGEYPVIPKEALFNLLDTSRGAKGNYNRYDDKFESGFYVTAENGLERPIDDRHAKIYGTRFNYELAIAMILMNNILRAQEYRIASKVFNPANFTPTSASVPWATAGTADPQADVEKGIAAMRANGIIPNALILNHTAFKSCLKVEAVKDQVFELFPDTQKTGNIGIQHLKSYFDIPNILVAGSMYNTAGTNKDATLADIWGDQYVMLARIAEGGGADISEPCIGRTFLWNEGAGDEVIVEEYREEGVRGDVLRVRHDSDETFLASFDKDKNVKSEISKACGYLMDVKES